MQDKTEIEESADKAVKEEALKKKLYVVARARRAASR